MRAFVCLLFCVAFSGCATSADVTKDIAGLRQQVAEIRDFQVSLGKFSADLDRRVDELARHEAQLRKDIEVVRSTASRDPAARDAILRMEEYVRSLERELREMRKVVDRVEIVTVSLPGIPPQEGLRVKAR